MNNKMSIIINPSTIQSKKQTKQTRKHREDHGYREHFGCQIGGGCGRMGEEVRG